MDEPLSNLDAKLRVQMRAEIGRLQRDLGVTTIYVTHDQTEAMTLGHRVAVMKKGVLQQIAPPQELYDRPTNLFVAGFIGSPAMNFLAGSLGRADDGGYAVTLGSEVLQVPGALVKGRPALARYVGERVIVGIRPEELEDAALVSGAPGHTINGVAELVEPLGSDLVVHLSVPVPPATGHDDLAELAKEAGDLPLDSGDSSTVVARFSPRSGVRVGDKVAVAVATEQMHFFDPVSGAAIWSD
jgi:multiple sugar transport system ATP-binding protein